jgi:hypothetical protein
MVACNTQPCDNSTKIDGEWDLWTDWSECSTSCQSGVTFRVRKIKTMAQEGGKEAVGPVKESKFCNAEVPCNQPVDCEFHDWSAWGGCSLTCNGVKKRTRRIKTYGRGKGKWCNGHLKEIFPCNPDAGQPILEQCKQVKPKEYKFGDWALWGACSKTCDGGVQTRERAIVEAVNGSRTVTGALTEALSCGSDCPGPPPVDCKFGEWEDWGACGKCGGQKFRFRHILVYPKNGGKQCKLEDTDETKACPIKCEKLNVCMWQDWDDWGTCTAKCGAGKRVRRRHLHAAAMPSSWDGHILSNEWDVSELEELRKKAASLERPDSRSLTLAFSSGSFAFAAAFLIFKAVVHYRSQNQASYASLETPVAAEMRSFERDPMAAPLVS